MFKIVEGRMQTKLQWLQDPIVVNKDNFSNVRREAGRYFRNKKREYLKDKINELDSKIIYTRISETGIGTCMNLRWVINLELT
jgi:hypothetical protein